MIEQLTGLNRHSGQLIDDHAHIWQSINDILTTPIGSRVMRREYGSLLAELIDKPMDDRLIMQTYAATAIAVMKYEPRIRVTALNVLRDSSGYMIFNIDYERLTPYSRSVDTFKFKVGTF